MATDNLGPESATVTDHTELSTVDSLENINATATLNTITDTSFEDVTIADIKIFITVADSLESSLTPEPELGSADDNGSGSVEGSGSSADGVVLTIRTTVSGLPCIFWNESNVYPDYGKENFCVPDGNWPWCQAIVNNAETWLYCNNGIFQPPIRTEEELQLRSRMKLDPVERDILRKFAEGIQAPHSWDQLLNTSFDPCVEIIRKGTIGCDSGHVYFLECITCSLVGTMANEIFALPYLEMIDFTFNKIGGKFPPMTSCSALKDLW